MNMITKTSKPSAGVAEPATSWRNWDDLVSNFFRNIPGIRNEWGFNSPGMDVEVMEKEVVVTVPFAGAKNEDFDVEIVGDCLTVSAERKYCSKEGCGNITRQERSTSRCCESITLPVKVIGQEATASYTDGVLTVKIPRAEFGCSCSHNVKIQ